MPRRPSNELVALVASCGDASAHAIMIRSRNTACEPWVDDWSAKPSGGSLPGSDEPVSGSDEAKDTLRGSSTVELEFFKTSQ